VPRQPNRGWENRSFRGYADYAMGEEFALGLTQLRDRASSRRTAMMCSEALWWRCHRRLIADRLLVGGDMVWHISSRGRASKHRMTPFASVGAGGRITYPSAEAGNPQASSGAPAAAIEGVASTTDREHYVNALQAMQNSSDQAAVAELNERLREIDAAIESNDFRKANIRAGYVYVISNRGALGAPTSSRSV